VALGCSTDPATPEGAPLYQPEDAARPTWTETKPLGVARMWHTATPLADGRVLVVGGQKKGSFDTGDVCSDTAEIYDPVMTFWEPTGLPMSAKRTQHVSVRLADGRVLVSGGYGCGAPLGVPTAEIYDPTADTWTLTGGAPASLRRRAAAVRLADDRVLLTGGDVSGSVGTAEIYDPASDTWTPAAPMKVARHQHTATLLPDGRVLVVGGDPGAGDAFASAELFDAALGTWKDAPPMKDRRVAHTATALAGGLVLIAGGSAKADTEAHAELASAELFDPAQGGFIELPAMAEARALHAAAMLDDGAVLVMGGMDATASALRSVELFDPDARAWAPISPLNHSRLISAAAPLPGGSAVVAGGENQSSSEVYRPRQKGEACTFGRECASGLCTEGVCCDTACTGLCHTCARADAKGTCSPAASGTDPHHECGQGGVCDDVCDGAGVCASRVGDVCRPAGCDADGTQAIRETTCAEKGGACPTELVDCGDYGCDPAAGACRSRCASVTDCAPGRACDLGGRCAQPPDVASDAGACGAAPAGGDGWWAALAALALARARRGARTRA
jgi:hypothetical protein